MVRIGVILAGQHLTHHNTLQTALDGLDLLEALDLKADIGQNFGHLLGRNIGFEIAFKPIVGNVHIA